MPKIKLNPRQLRNLMVTFLLSIVVAIPVLCQPLGLPDLLTAQAAGDIINTDTAVESAYLLAPLESLEYVDQVLNRGMNENMISLTESEPIVLDGEDETVLDGDPGENLDPAALAALAAELGEIGDLETAVEPPIEEAVEPTEPQPVYTAVDYILFISAGQLNLRAGPSTESEILAELKFGDKVSCVGENADWMQVTFNDLTGYVKTEYTSKTMVFREVSKTVYVKSSKLNLRQEPTTESGIIMSLAYMTKLTCTGEGDGWSKVKTSAGKVGYVSSQYLTTKAASTSTSSAGTSTATGGSAPRNSSGNTIVDMAYSALGVRYVSGGSSMSGFDCSGLTSWCYRQAGITISRSAASYYSVGTAVAYSNIQPGDILCLDTRRSDGRTSITHVAIYVGNGMMIHASSTNHKVVLQNVSQYLSWGVKLLSVRRVAG